MSWLMAADEVCQLVTHQRIVKKLKLAALSNSNLRQAEYVSTIGGVTVDYSNNLVVDETFNLLLNLSKLVAGETLEGGYKYFLHAHQRNRTPEDDAQLRTVYSFANAVRQGTYQSAKGRPIQHIVHIGIGGSALGPRMVYEALDGEQNERIKIHFLSNLCPLAFQKLMKNIDLDETLFFFCSKSFDTNELIQNQKRLLALLDHQLINRQCFAITANAEKALGVFNSENIISLPKELVGRFSLWSEVSLSIMVALGVERFRSLLMGARRVDEHVRSQELLQNLPLKLALIDVWLVNFFNADTRAIIPYISTFSQFISFVQQMMMESNGKTCDRNGESFEYATCPIIWGGIGSDSQHSIHQLLLQGSFLTPTDFIYLKTATDNKDQPYQDLINKQVMSQSKAFAEGNLFASPTPEKVVVGNKMHHLISIGRLTPDNLGTLIALYEYRTIYSALIWNINPFDQCGVELGKTIFRQTFDT